MRNLRGVIALMLGAAMLLVSLHPTGVEAASPTALLFPAPAGTTWQILAGYNTATHSVADANDPYAVDLQRTDAPSAGTAVLAPVSGTVGYVSSSCLSIRDANRTTVLLCHLFAPQSLRGTTVTRGQQIGVVAPAGEANNNGVAHIHLALSPSTGGPLPFTGAYTLDGVDLPAITTSNGYAGTAFTSTNRALPGVDAGIDRTVRPGDVVTLTGAVTNASGAGIAYTWTQTSGTTVALQSAGPNLTFTAPSKSGALQFRLAVTDGADVVSDTIAVNVSTTQPVSVVGAAAGGFVANPTFGTNAQALAVFPGGPITQLEAAARAVGASGVWVQDSSGGYQLLVVGGATFLRDLFNGRFPSGLAGPTAVTLVR